MDLACFLFLTRLVKLMYSKVLLDLLIFFIQSDSAEHAIIYLICSNIDISA